MTVSTSSAAKRAYVSEPQYPKLEKAAPPGLDQLRSAAPGAPANLRIVHEEPLFREGDRFRWVIEREGIKK